MFEKLEKIPQIKGDVEKHDLFCYKTTCSIIERPYFEDKKYQFTDLDTAVRKWIFLQLWEEDAQKYYGE